MFSDTSPIFSSRSYRRNTRPAGDIATSTSSRGCAAASRRRRPRRISMRALGVAIATWSVQSLRALAVTGGYVPERVAIAVDARVFAFSLIVSIVCGTIFGIGPALQASSVDLNEGLRDSGHAHSSGSGRARARRALIVSELVLSLLLLAGFGLLMR